ncbi:hypothetical protein C5167_042508 [Papaver somniferum]|uniref:Uncharacterized protein n=1 Tax=Papaver somniferum TaxID=3469 RepID=A0A4Y7L309_PAPSO|nr:hypothetical protein C5167_042508 [Papaver somniferum]
MAMRVILTKISPFASSNTSSLGFIEGAQRIRRHFLDTEAYRSGKLDKAVYLKEDITMDEFNAMSWEDIK